jgi:hypothetical protein
LFLPIKSIAFGRFDPALGLLELARQVRNALLRVFELQFKHCIGLCGLVRSCADFRIHTHELTFVDEPSACFVTGSREAPGLDGAQEVAAVNTYPLCGRARVSVMPGR